MSGTSMATPAAAGIIALWLQVAKDKNKTLTNADIKDIIAHSSDTDKFTEKTPVSIYNLQGVRVGQTTVEGGAIVLDGLTQGVYAVQLGKLGSTLIRM